MLAPLLGAVRADIDRQVGWVKAEVRRQTRHTALVGTLAGIAALAALGAIVIALIALYFWLAIETDPFTALGVIGGGLLLLAVILFAAAFVRRRPQLASRPLLQSTQPAALLGLFRLNKNDDKVIADSEQTLQLAADTLRHGSRSALVTTLLLVAVAGMLAGRRMQQTAPPRRPSG